jgi:hypothetical protein
MEQQDFRNILLATRKEDAKTWLELGTLSEKGLPASGHRLHSAITGPAADIASYFLRGALDNPFYESMAWHWNSHEPIIDNDDGTITVRATRFTYRGD